MDGTDTGAGIAVSNPGDRFEREAESLADQALGAPARPGRAGAGPSAERRPLARTAALGGHASAFAGRRATSTTGGGRTLARVCLPAAECAGHLASLSTFVQDTEAKPENKRKQSKREADCLAHRPACTSDGHAAPAAGLTAFLASRSPARLNYISGIFVNKDMPADYGALTQTCASFMPPLPTSSGKRYCTTVPAGLEAQAQLYMNVSAKAETIGGVPRYTWVTNTLTTLTHETEHGRFDTASENPANSPLKGPTSGTCKPDDVESELSEMAAQMAEFPILLRRIEIMPKAARERRLAAWFVYHLSNRGENMTDTLKTLRCKCECSEVDAYVKQVVSFVQTGWNSYEKSVYHTEMKRPAHRLAWPVDPPDAIDVNDLPLAQPALDVEDLPFARP